ncbi:Uncharacterized protein QTN25_007044 [Entamoeba marina]
MSCKLERIFLMNVALYLPDYESFLDFMQINTKCKEAFESLHVNPFSTAKLILNTRGAMYKALVNQIETLCVDISHYSSVPYSHLTYIRFFKYFSSYYFFSGLNPEILKRIERTPARQGEFDYIMKNPELFPVLRTINVESFFEVNQYFQNIVNLKKLQRVVVSFSSGNVNFSRLSTLIEKLQLQVDFIFIIPYEVVKQIDTSQLDKRIQFYTDVYDETIPSLATFSMKRNLTVMVRDLPFSNYAKVVEDSLPDSIIFRKVEDTYGNGKEFSLKNHPTIQSLEFHGNFNGFSGLDIPNLVVSSVETISLHNCFLNIICDELRTFKLIDVDNRSFSNIPNLKKLALINCRHIDASALTSIEELDLSNVIDSKVVIGEKLGKVDFSETKDVTFIYQNPKKEIIELLKSFGTHFNYSDNQSLVITDYDVDELNLSNLQYNSITFKNCHIKTVIDTTPRTLNTLRTFKTTIDSLTLNATIDLLKEEKKTSIKKIKTISVNKFDNFGDGIYDIEHINQMEIKSWKEEYNRFNPKILFIERVENSDKLDLTNTNLTHITFKESTYLKEIHIPTTLMDITFKGYYSSIPEIIGMEQSQIPTKRQEILKQKMKNKK